jgi:hypothetical protein
MKSNNRLFKVRSPDRKSACALSSFFLSLLSACSLLEPSTSDHFNDENQQLPVIFLLFLFHLPFFHLLLLPVLLSQSITERESESKYDHDMLSTPMLKQNQPNTK